MANVASISAAALGLTNACYQAYRSLKKIKNSPETATDWRSELLEHQRTLTLLAAEIHSRCSLRNDDYQLKIIREAPHRAAQQCEKLSRALQELIGGTTWGPFWTSLVNSVRACIRKSAKYVLNVSDMITIEITRKPRIVIYTYTIIGAQVGSSIGSLIGLGGGFVGGLIGALIGGVVGGIVGGVVGWWCGY